MTSPGGRLLLGAHVSTGGGVELAPARGAAIGAEAIQIFTKQVNRWAEREIGPQTAEAIRRALDAVGGGTRVLLEGTAGQGTALGSSFEELAELLERIGPRHQSRLGICLDTAHLFAAGYDIVGDYEGVIVELDGVVVLERVGLFHLNDSKAPLGSRVDRHEQIAKGHLGPGPFRCIMRDKRFRDVPKLIETSKGDDPVHNDRRNLRYLRRCASAVRAVPREQAADDLA